MFTMCELEETSDLELEMTPSPVIPTGGARPLCGLGAGAEGFLDFARDRSLDSLFSPRCGLTLAPDDNDPPPDRSDGVHPRRITIVRGDKPLAYEHIGRRHPIKQRRPPG
jgi:hypothetical protein